MSLENKDEIIDNCKIAIEVVSDTAEIDKKLEKLSKELETIAVSVSEYVNKNASETLSQDEYINEYTKLTKNYEKKAKQRERLISEKEDKFRRADEIRRYVQKMIETKNSVTEWDDTLWLIFLLQLLFPVLCNCCQNAVSAETSASQQIPVCYSAADILPS